MTKDQLKYLSNKINQTAEQAIKEFREANPIRHSREQVIDALKAAGFVTYKEGGFGGAAYDWRYAVDYITLPPTPEMEANIQKVKEYTDKITAVRQKAIDTANLGDSNDALAILAEFAEAIKDV